MDRGGFAKKEKNPRETTNFISLFTFFYILRLFKKGYTKGLEFGDVYEVLSNCRSEKLTDRLEKYWHTKKSQSLCRALLWCFGRTFIILGMIQLVATLTLTILSPHAQSKLISYFSPDQTELSKSDAIYFGCIVIGLNVFKVFFFHNFKLYVLALGLGVKAAVSSLLYRKSLKLNCVSLSQVTLGKITTIINRDVEIFQQFVSQANDIWIALVKTAMICYLIYHKIGIASWAGVTFFFVILPLQMFIGKLAYNYRLKCSKTTDERLEITQEVLSAIKIIKMYTWEKYFEKKICDARKAELQRLHKLFYSRVWINVIGGICSKVAFFIFLMTYVWMDNSVSAETVYYILSCFGDLQGSLSNSIPSGFSGAAEVYAVIKRCDHVLNCQEMTPKPQSTEIVCPHITFSNVSVKIFDTPVLKNISLDIYQGLTLVVGHVGSGKSTFLKAIMQDCDMTGSVRVLGTISYASEEPWLFPSTIKNNILFGEEYLEKRYREVLRICGLDYDLDSIEGGDGTIIGERGINLSKGQQARVNLARALYRNSDIYLLDDCFASLDADVSDHIFRECRQKMKSKICIFVTSNFDYVNEADRVIMLDHGSIQSSKDLEKKLPIGNLDFEMEQSTKVEEIASAPIYHEVKNMGKVTLADYFKYVSYGGGIIIFCLIMGLFMIQQGASSYSEKLLSKWVTLEQEMLNLKVVNLTNSSEFEELYKKRTKGLTLYCVVFSIGTILYIITIFSYFFFIRTASTNMHKAMLKTIINATMKFFDRNFIGNILTRFSKDCVTIDEYLPFVLVGCLTMIFVVSGGMILLTTVNIVFLLECLLLLIVAYMIKRFSQPTGRNLQRLHVMARCPMVGHVNSSLTGLSTIRACNAQEMLIKEFDRYQNQFTSTHYMLDNSLIALSFSLEFVCTLLITSIIIQFLANDSDTTVGDVGLAISQAFTISEIIANGIRGIADTENLMTSVERILEYVRLEKEDKSGSVLREWPKLGSIDFNGVTLSYGSAKKEMLKSLLFRIFPREKLGIVGRTGAGKSSIVSSLFRLYDIQGKILIDGVDIRKVSLNCLRSNISVITQDPFLFSGSIRDNLDPLKNYTDDEIWRVLDDLRLKQSIGDLSMKVDKGSTFSAGQRQLLCLARVILRKNKIVILDEATATLDQETDSLIHEAVSKYFARCTVITIAHRLLAVMDCDRVLVMKNGEISESDEPKKLLQNKSSFFHSIVK